MPDHSVQPERRRLPKQERRAQLLDVARSLVREAGTDELTLGRVAERAGVTKPLVYGHFGDRAGLLAELHREFEARQREVLAVALRAVPRDLSAVVDIVAGAYIDCCVAEGVELADVVAALAGSPALSLLRQEAEDAYLAMCEDALAPFVGEVESAALRAIIGAGDALARSALNGSISPDQARRTLSRVIAAVATGDKGRSR